MDKSLLGKQTTPGVQQAQQIEQIIILHRADLQTTTNKKTTVSNKGTPRNKHQGITKVRLSLYPWQRGTGAIA
eukprot:9658045-Ditylum_brightwellii.AAC.1